jgi:hypothetical protein
VPNKSFTKSISCTGDIYILKVDARVCDGRPKKNTHRTTMMMRRYAALALAGLLSLYFTAEAFQASGKCADRAVVIVMPAVMSLLDNRCFLGALCTKTPDRPHHQPVIMMPGSWWSQ